MQWRVVPFLFCLLNSTAFSSGQLGDERSAVRTRTNTLKIQGQTDLQARQSLLSNRARRSFPDTWEGIHIFNDQISPGGLTDAQIRFAATHYDGCQKMTRRYADYLREINPKFVILHYRLGLALGYRVPDNQCLPNGDWIQIIDDHWVREWPGDDALMEEWFYHYNNQRVFNCDWGWYLMDTDRPEWQQVWISQVLREMSDNDDDGLFADSVSIPNELGADRFSPNLPSMDSGFEAEWSGRIERWILFVKEQFLGRYWLVPNVGAWVTTRDHTDYSGADGVMVEGFSQWGPGQPFALADWKLQMDRILQLVRLDRIILAQSYLGAAEDISTRMFYLGNYLLIKGQHTYLNVELSQQPEWFPEYSVPLGRPVETNPARIEDLRLPQSEAYARRYTNGLVVVNPSGNSQVIAMDRSYYQAIPYGGGVVPPDSDLSNWGIDYQIVKTVTLQPGEAMILLTAGP